MVSKHYHGLKCRKLRLLQQGQSFEKHMLFQNMSLSLKKRQFLLVRAVGRTEKGGCTTEGILSLSVDEDDVLNHRRFNLHCDAIDVLKLIARWMNFLSIITWKSLLFWASVIL